jgi:hypothetical protein
MKSKERTSATYTVCVRVCVSECVCVCVYVCVCVCGHTLSALSCSTTVARLHRRISGTTVCRRSLGRLWCKHECEGSGDCVSISVSVRVFLCRSGPINVIV